MPAEVEREQTAGPTEVPGPYRYRAPLPPARFNMARYCVGAPAASYPDKPALLVFDNPTSSEPCETWTFREIEDAVLRIAAALKAHGLSPGSRLLLRMHNTSTFPLVFFGAIAAGVVPVPTSSQLTDREVAFLIDECRPAAVVLSDGLELPPTSHEPRVFDNRQIGVMLDFPVSGTYAATQANDPAYLIYTSGTTAYPKGVLHAHRSAWGRRPMYDGWYGLTPADRMLHAGAFNWTYTLGTGLTDPWAVGATAIVYTGEKSPEVWVKLIANSGATLFAAVPGLVRQILKYAPPAPGSVPTLRHGLIAGETPPAGLFEDWERATGLPLYEALGMSEISTYVSSGPSVRRRAGAIGKAQAGRAVVVLPDGDDEARDPLVPVEPGQDGLLAVHRTDPGLMLGYWNRPEEEASVFRGEWFIGGDRARMDEDGYITHLGRANDVMNALGYRVAPQEVEAVLMQHPDIGEVACGEITVGEGVSVIGAFVVPKDTVSPSDADSIVAFTEGKLADYKRPREVRFVEALPRTANGKVQRSLLGKLCES